MYLWHLCCRSRFSRVDSGGAKKAHGKAEKVEAPDDETGVEPVEEDEALHSLTTNQHKDNFFNFHDTGQDVWGPNFTRTLRNTR